MRIALPESAPWPFGDRTEMDADEFNRLVSGMPPTIATAPPDGPEPPEAWQTSEKRFQARVVKYATEHGWDDPKPYHTHDSASSEPGFPDLVMGRGVRLEFVELKVGDNKPTRQQEQWLRRFRAVSDAAKAFGFDWIGVRVWWPDDWQTIEEVLK